ncbi:hypothetical protein AAMO2058_000657200 [Amorphochlora amoebiformis]
MEDKHNAKDEEERHTSVLSKFQEMLMGEEESYVDIEQLRDLFRAGIPPSIRGQVWKYLIGVDHTKDGKKDVHSREDIKVHPYLEHSHKLARAISQDVDEFLKRFPKLRDKAKSIKMRELLSSYICTHPSVTYRPGLVSIIGTCASTLTQATDIYVTFSRIVDFTSIHTQSQLSKELATFLLIFRRFLPNLSRRFRDEGVSPNDWALPWIQNYLADCLPIECTLRLWDTYLCEKDGWGLHKYVCLAILSMCEEDLLELDQEELCWFLRQLPKLDVELVILSAKNIQSVR